MHIHVRGCGCGCGCVGFTRMGLTRLVQWAGQNIRSAGQHIHPSAARHRAQGEYKGLPTLGILISGALLAPANIWGESRTLQWRSGLTRA
eukprot:4054620-Pyramimonas_sp.AAC.1